MNSSASTVRTMPLRFSPDGSEQAARDQAIGWLEEARTDLVASATAIADRVARQYGRVTSTDVLNIMRDNPELERRMQDVDLRFMGAVFSRKKGWVHLGYEQTGSHARPVSIWGR